MPTLLSDSTAQDTAQMVQLPYVSGTAFTVPTDHQTAYACVITGHTPDLE